jgi:metalloendopeptidase OMA1, mitochondrial
MRSGIVVLGLLLLVARCVTNPDTGRKGLNFVPDSYMNQMGVAAYAEILKTEKLSTDKRLTDVVTAIGKRIATASGRDFRWEVKLIENPKMVNAFCLPGGKIAVYTGIIPVALNNAGLAAVLGHEVAHAIARHGAERMSQGLVAQVGMVAVDQALTDSKYRGPALAALGLGAQVGVLLPFSRQHESEADEMGLKYMAKAGYDPAEAVALWNRMAKVGGKTPEIISTHPDPTRRAQTLESLQAEVLPFYQQSTKQPTIPL